MANRLFYLSTPPDVFVDVTRCVSSLASPKDGWTRVIVEKPFGRDSESSAELTRGLKVYLTEDQIFRYAEASSPTHVLLARITLILSDYFVTTLLL